MGYRLRTALAASIVCAAALSTAEAGSRVVRDFDAGSSLRITQNFSLSGSPIEARFYSGYQPDRVTIANRTASEARFESYQGYVARVTPGAVFDVPCEGREIAGRLAMLDQASATTVNEQALCGDLVIIQAEGGS